MRLFVDFVLLSLKHISRIKILRPSGSKKIAEKGPKKLNKDILWSVHGLEGFGEKHHEENLKTTEPMGSKVYP